MREDLAVSMEFGVGSVLEGKVTGITKFGAFVSLPEGKSGLVHISEIAYSYVNDVKDHLKEGQEVKVKVIGIDENGRINLSIKKAMDPPPRPAGQGRPMGRPGGHNGGGFRGKPAPAEPASFEDRLKQFMAASDSKLSELRQSERRSSRRGGRKYATKNSPPSYGRAVFCSQRGGGGPPSQQFFIQGGGVGLAHVLGHRQHLHLYGALAEAQLQHVARLHVVAGLHRPAVGRDPGVVTGLVGHRPALDEPGDLQPFVQSHGNLPPP